MGLRPIFVVILFFILLPPRVSGLELPYEETHFQHRRCLVVAPAGLPDDAPVILVLHGSLGSAEASEGGFYEGSGLPTALWLFPEGPIVTRKKSAHAVVTYHAWYNRFTHSYNDMKKSREFLVALLEHYSKWAKGGDGEDRVLEQPRKVIVVGESQGGVMTFETALNYPGPLLAIASVDGFIEYPEKTLAPKNLHILLQNGTLDPVIQKEDAQATVSRLQKLGYHPFLHFYGVGHQITQGRKEDLWGFLRGVMKEKNMAKR